MIRALFVTLCLLASAAQAETIDVRNAKLDVCGRFELYHINGVSWQFTAGNQGQSRY